MSPGSMGFALERLFGEQRAEGNIACGFVDDEAFNPIRTFSLPFGAWLASIRLSIFFKPKDCTGF